MIIKNKKKKVKTNNRNLENMNQDYCEIKDEV